MSKNRFITTTRIDKINEPIYVVILAGSLGYKEKSKGPCILQVHEGQTILNIQVKTILQRIPKAIISTTTGFQAEKVIKNKPQIGIIENQLWETTNTMEEVRLYLNSVCPKRLILIDGAIYFNHHALDILDESSILSYTNDNPQEVGVHSNNQVVEHLGYGLKKKWSGIAYLEGQELELFTKLAQRDKNRLSLFEGINLILERGAIIRDIVNTKAEIYKV